MGGSWVDLGGVDFGWTLDGSWVELGWIVGVSETHKIHPRSTPDPPKVHPRSHTRSTQDTHKVHLHRDSPRVNSRSTQDRLKINSRPSQHPRKINSRSRPIQDHQISIQNVGCVRSHFGSVALVISYSAFCPPPCRAILYVTISRSGWGHDWSCWFSTTSRVYWTGWRLTTT